MTAFHEQRTRKRPALARATQSVLAAAFGVQASRKLDEDLKHGSAKAYIAGGVLFTILFVLGVSMVVRGVLAGIAS